MSEELLLAISATIDGEETWGDWDGEPYIPPDSAAIAVLAMPEMQAIRAALHNLHAAKRDDVGHAGALEWLRAMNLPPSVVAWVLTEPKTATAPPTEAGGASSLGE